MLTMMMQVIVQPIIFPVDRKFSLRRFQAANIQQYTQAMGDDQLRIIAQELLNSLRSNACVDWQHRESARARMRILVKRILRKYGYPPDLQDAAVQTVLQQAEVLSARWAA